ncbi:sensor histidine kinase [Umezawaea beigongshangensis]|uniref:sensor histidine kinase n=1 Tax=Umezawaea beigongshangensis TaxID=2780383 RepID=UPI0018F21F81|nr:sensor histidine kinase [Umezawaea beigongshangensis]
MTGAADARGLIHQGLLYGADEQFLAATVPFCRDGLERGDAVLAVTTATNADLLRDGLGADAGHVRFVDADTWYDTPGRTLAAYHRYVDERADGDGRVRVIGEPVWHGRDDLAVAEWTRYESVINLAFADSPAWIVCPYDTRVVPERIVDDARRTHPDLVVGSLAETSPAYLAPALLTTGARRAPAVAGEGGAVLRFGSDLAAVRRFVADTADSLGLSPTRTEHAVVAVNEVATNVLDHGGGSGWIALRRTGGRIVCDVADDGPAPLADWFAGYLPPAPGQRLGVGLWVVRQLCDLVEIQPRDTGTTVSLHFDV